MIADIKKIEDLSLNAWPSHQMQLYDGWILRFSYFYTHRTNCIEEIGPSTIPLAEKIRYCEEIYRRWRTPCIFKITPLTERRLDRTLMDRGYRIEHTTEVMRLHTLPVRDPSGRIPSLPPGCRLRKAGRVDGQWLKGLFALKGTTDPEHLRIVPAMYDAIPKDEIAVSVLYSGRVIATGLGILDRDEAGIYAIHTDAAFRRKGVASCVIRTILMEAGSSGARGAYLQVVSGNTPAQRLYGELGFTKSYTCWYRVKSFE